MPMFSMCLIGFSALSRTLKGTYLVKVPHLTRVSIVTVMQGAAFSIISFCAYRNTVESSFWISFLASVLVGSLCALGEATILGFNKALPSYLVGGFSSGTGGAGLSGNLTLLILTGIGLQDYQIFLVSIVTIFPYILSFRWIDKQVKMFGKKYLQKQIKS